MAEALGVVASIIAVLEASKKVIKYIDSVKGSFAQRCQMRQEISGVEFSLGALKNRMKEADRMILPLPALESLKGALEQTKATLDIIEGKLTRPNGSKKWLDALRWTFEKQEVEDLLDAIQRQNRCFIDALDYDHL